MVNKYSDTLSSAEARARRVESVRKITGLSRRAFQEKYGISAGTLQNWEDVKANGLTEKGAIKLVKVLKPDGINCTVEWLMYGIGQAPQIPDYLQSKTIAHPKLSYRIDSVTEASLIAEELLLFRQHYPDAIDIVVIDDGMEPCFMVGDHIAGVRRNSTAIAMVVGHDCIVQTIEGDVLLRNVKKGSAEGLYTLVCINQQTTVTKPILYDVPLFTAAPVVWMRRKVIL